MKYVLTAIACLVASGLFAQDRCAAITETYKEIERDPAYADGFVEFEELSQSFAEGWYDQHDTRDGFKEVVIPVVVHVLYREEENNISYEQIVSQIDVLNRDFNWENTDKDKIPEVWRDLGAPTHFRFQLANRDPDGNPTNGVTRTQTTVENIGSEEIYHLKHRGGVEPWDRPHYMNVWVCELKGNTLGFAILPSAKMSDRDGIVISPRAFGTMGTVKAPYNKGRTFVHEVGHYFGLRHLWGDDEDESCGDTDYIDDTPKQKKENFGCATYPSISCNNGPHGDMFMNYMDYGNDTCMLLFTKRQVEFMQLVMKTNRRALFFSNGITSVNDAAPSRWKLYPNPSNGIVHIEFGNELPQRIFMTNAVGQVVHGFSPHRAIERVDVSHLPAGIYYLRSDRIQEVLILQ